VGITYTSLVHFSSNINQYKRVYIIAKIAKHVGLERHENFCWTNFNKIRKFLRDRDKFSTNCAVDKHNKLSMEIRISVDIQKVK